MAGRPRFLIWLVAPAIVALCAGPANAGGYWYWVRSGSGRVIVTPRGGSSETFYLREDPSFSYPGGGWFTGTLDYLCTEEIEYVWSRDESETPESDPPPGG